jgi:hypothetical protein
MYFASNHWCNMKDISMSFKSFSSAQGVSDQKKAQVNDGEPIKEQKPAQLNEAPAENTPPLKG